MKHLFHQFLSLSLILSIAVCACDGGGVLAKEGETKNPEVDSSEEGQESDAEATAGEDSEGPAATGTMQGSDGCPPAEEVDDLPVLANEYTRNLADIQSDLVEFDHLEMRSQYFYCSDTPRPWEIKGSTGTECENAGDAAACMQALEAKWASLVTWDHASDVSMVHTFPYGGSEMCPGLAGFAHTSGDEVALVTDIPAFFGEIDSPTEAELLVAAVKRQDFQPLRFEVTDDGYKFVTSGEYGCPSVLRKNHWEVTRDGRICNVAYSLKEIGRCE